MQQINACSKLMYACFQGQEGGAHQSIGGNFFTHHIAHKMACNYRFLHTRLVSMVTFHSCHGYGHRSAGSSRKS